MMIEKRILEFEKLGFGMFVHFGLYSVLGKGEWAMSDTNIVSRQSYKELIDQFCVKEGFFREIAETAKNAGCKYIILTTRHHDGFSLYDTKGLSEFDVMKSPTKRDLVKEFVDECNNFGLIPFLYHTGVDWTRESFNNDFKSYLEYLRESVELLCTNYGKIGGFWFDGFWDRDDWEFDKLTGVIRKYQPDSIIVLNRGLVKNEKHNHDVDCLTFERHNPRKESEIDDKYRAREMCQVIHDHWGYASFDFNMKSTKALLNDFCCCRKFNSNFVLNVGPSLKGLSLQEKAVFDVFGRWIEIQGDVVFNGEIQDQMIVDNDNDFVKKLGEDYYLFVHNLTTTGDINVALELREAKPVMISNFDREVLSVQWLDNDENLQYSREGQNIKVKCTNFSYSKNLIVRIAKIKVK